VRVVPGGGVEGVLSWNRKQEVLTMKRTTAVFAWVVLALALAANAPAQVKEVPGDTVTVSGTVEAIDHTSRVLTLKKDEGGEFETVDVPAGAKRFDEIKVGDKVTARYYDNVTVRLKKPGEAPVNAAEAAVTPGTGAKPGATLAAQRTMTAVIEAIDPKVPSITFKGPKGWKYSRRVQDKNVLKQVKVGDQVDFTWTEAVTIEVAVPKK
jgi:Cu/Ag efflux protein CusF